MREWFKEHEYDFQEKEQTTKEKSVGKELRIVWEGERKFDDYTKFFIKVEFFIEQLTQENGKEKGNIKITFWAWMILDYNKRWQTSSLKKFLMFVYNNYIIKKLIVVDYENKLKSDAYALQNIAKEHFE